MEERETKRYYEAFLKNEVDANKQMVLANLLSAGIMTLAWILYLTKVISVPELVHQFIVVLLPVNVLILLIPFILSRTKIIEKTYFKNIVIFCFIIAVSILNVLVPKHTVIAWALCIVMVNHYYNPKFGRIVFIAVSVMMLLSLYGGMFLGEYDAGLLGFPPDGKSINGIIERYNYLHEKFVNGDNRYLAVLLYYYTSRFVLLLLTFIVSNALNKRSYKLLVESIRIASTLEKEHTELEVAKELQISTLPSSFLSYGDLEIQAELKAAKEVGGDFYDYLRLDNSHIAIIIGDVSGKGIPAAMFMMRALTCFRIEAKIDSSPASILKRMNDELLKGNEKGMFVTCFLAILDEESGKVVYANAAHLPPVVGSSKHYRYLKVKNGFLLGVMEEVNLVDEEFYLKNGESITLYTDGITEARNPKGEFFGDLRLINLFNKKSYSCLLELHHVLKDEITSFMQDAPQSDDITYLTLRYHGDHYLFEEYTYETNPDLVKEVEEQIASFANKCNLDASFVKDLKIVCDELISNIIKYAYPDQKSGIIYLRMLYNIDLEEFTLTIIDHGIPFNPFLENNNPLDEDYQNRAVGGLGILIVKNLLSEYAYDRLNDKNILTLRKKR